MIGIPVAPQIKGVFLAAAQKTVIAGIFLQMGRQISERPNNKVMIFYRQQLKMQNAVDCFWHFIHVCPPVKTVTSLIASIAAIKLLARALQRDGETMQLLVPNLPTNQIPELHNSFGITLFTYLPIKEHKYLEKKTFLLKIKHLFISVCRTARRWVWQWMVCEEGAQVPLAWV